MRATALWITLVFAAAMIVPGATANAEAEQLPTDLDNAPPVRAGAECAPPCGYIYPVITLRWEHTTPVMAADIPDVPETSKVWVSVWWDMEQEGTGLPEDPEMVIKTDITTKPEWMDADLDGDCRFMLLPHQAEYNDVCEYTLHIEVLDVPDSVEDIEERGKRLMLFSTSSESGTFKQSYGVKDIRFKPDDTLALTEADLVVEESPLMAPVALVGLALLGAAAVRRRTA